jgi:dTDP-4-amino-4,6-dideoxygalactose transaminase
MATWVAQPALPDLDEFVEEIRELFSTKVLTNMGPVHRRFQAALEDFLGVPHVTLFTNGHLALEGVLQALGLTGEVITTPYTFASTVHAIVRCRLTPVFCDITPDDYTIDAGRIEALITERTSAIVPVHVYGTPCDTAAIEEIARRHGLKVVYDAAHAFGVTVAGRPIGSFGDASMFSFHATKVFHTVEGGAVAYADDGLVTPLNRVKNFGIAGPDSVTAVGGNAKLDEFRAALGLCNLRHHGANIARRGQLSARYDAGLKGVAGLKTLTFAAGVEPSYPYYPIEVDPDRFGASRDDVAAALEAEDIHPRRYFSPPANEFECYAGRFDAAATPVAHGVAQRILTLPLHTGLDEADIDRISALVRSAGR